VAARWQVIVLMQPSFQAFSAAIYNQYAQAASRNRAGLKLSRAVARSALTIFRKRSASERTTGSRHRLVASEAGRAEPLAR
jgi:hypothetical protein